MSTGGVLSTTCLADEVKQENHKEIRIPRPSAERTRSSKGTTDKRVGGEMKWTQGLVGSPLWRP